MYNFVIIRTHLQNIIFLFIHTADRENNSYTPVQQSDTGHVSNSAPESHHMDLDFTSSDSHTRHSPRMSTRLHNRGANHSSQDQRTISSQTSDMEVPPYPGTSIPDSPDFAMPPPSYYEVMHSK